MTLTDSQFIEQFENTSLNPAYFNHRGHLRLVWLYLNQYDLTQAIEKTADGINAYANSLGASDKYHHTVTEAVVKIANERIIEQQPTDFDCFLTENHDIVTDLIGVLNSYYSPERLQSKEARTTFVEPDIRPLAGIT